MTLSTQWNIIMDQVILECKALPDLTDVTSNNGFNATTATSPTGTLSAVQFTGLTPGVFIDSFDLNVNVASGNVRISVYGDAVSTPDLLLGESPSIPVATTGEVNFRLQKQVEVPQDGILWLSYENDDAGLDLDLSTGQSSGTLYTVSHTYGTAPSPFGGSAGTSPFWAQLHSSPKVVKHYGVRGSQPENFFCVVAARDMTIVDTTMHGSNNKFQFDVDVSYHGVDFQHGLSRILDLCSEIYDAIHNTNLNNTVQHATVEITMEEIVEGENLYLIGARCNINCQKLVFQS
jgi:hypothetical protein